MIVKNYKKETDESLIAYIYKGNGSAFNELYTRYSQRLFLFFLRMLNGDEEKAKDFLQDIFITVIEKTHYFDCNKIFSRWVFTIAKNMCLNEYNALKIKKRKVYQMEPGFFRDDQFKYDPMIDEEIDRKKFMRSLLMELDKLEQESKAVFILRFQENLKITEISEILSLPQGTVKSRLFYTVKKIAEKLKKLNPNL